MNEKILGAIMGLCVGDALGVPVEFASHAAATASSTDIVPHAEPSHSRVCKSIIIALPFRNRPAMKGKAAQLLP
jgi:hypothetical protein